MTDDTRLTSGTLPTTTPSSRGISTASSPTTSAWRSKRGSRRRPSWRAELDEITVARARRARAAATRRAGRFLGRGRSRTWKRPTTSADAADADGATGRRHRAPAEPEVARGLDRRCRGRRRRGDRGDRGARAQRGASERHRGRHAARRGHRRRGRLDQLPRPDGPAGGTPMRGRFVVVVCVVTLTGVGLVGALHAAGAESSSSEGARLITRDARGAARDAVLGRGARHVARPRQAERHHRLASPATTVRSRSSRGRHGCSTPAPARTSRAGSDGRARSSSPNRRTCPHPTTAGRCGVRRGPHDRGPSHPAGRSDPRQRDRGRAAVSRRRHQPAPAPRGARHARPGAAVAEFLDLDDRRRSRAAALHAGVQHAEGRSARRVPPGYEAPSTPSGYVLIGRSRHPNGIELLYSDGLFTVSVLEQRGDLDTDGMSGGTAVDVGGNRAPRYVGARSATCSCGSATARCTPACPTRRPT